MFERRFWESKEIRAGEDEGGAYLEGYAIPYEQLSVMLWGFREEIARGAFADSIANDDVRALWQHDASQVLGRTKNRTLQVMEDSHGVEFKVYPADTQPGRDALTSVRRGDVDQVSFGFSVAEGDDDWRESEDGTIIRRVNRGKLFEVSPVTWAAYPQTVVQARGLPTGQGYIDDDFGLVVPIPESLRRAPGDSTDTEQARARRDHRQRKLHLLSMR